MPQLLPARRRREARCLQYDPRIRIDVGGAGMSRPCGPSLMALAIRCRRRRGAEAARRCLEVEDLKVHFPVTQAACCGGRRARSRPSTARASAFAKARRSASSASPAAASRRSAARSCASTSRPTAAIRYRRPKRRAAGRSRDGSTSARCRPYRVDIRMIFQDPFTSLNPRMHGARRHRRSRSRANGLADGSELRGPRRRADGARSGCGPNT